MPLTTPNLGLTKPDIGQTDWGTSMNANLDTVDTQVASKLSKSDSAQALTNVTGTGTKVVSDSGPTVDAATLTNVVIGSGGTPITYIKLYNMSFTPASVPAQSVTEQTFSVTGVQSGDKVFVNPPAFTVNIGVVGVRVSATNTIAIRFVNPTAGALTPDAGTWRVVTFRL